MEGGEERGAGVSHTCLPLPLFLLFFLWYSSDCGSVTGKWAVHESSRTLKCVHKHTHTHTLSLY